MAAELSLQLQELQVAAAAEIADTRHLDLDAEWDSPVHTGGFPSSDTATTSDAASKPLSNTINTTTKKTSELQQLTITYAINRYKFAVINRILILLIIQLKLEIYINLLVTLI